MDIRDACEADWRAFDGYRYTVEHSVYVRSDARGCGVGRHLMTVLIARARKLGKHVMVAVSRPTTSPSLDCTKRSASPPADDCLRWVSTSTGGSI